MNTSADEFDREGGGSPSSAGFAPSALPFIQTPTADENAPEGVSTHYAQNRTNLNGTTLQWFALRCAYGRVKKAADYLEHKYIHTFCPTITEKKEVEGKTTQVEKIRIPNLFFAHSTFDILKDFVYDNVHEETKHLRFYYNLHHDGTKEPLIVPDYQINTFKLICEADASDVILEPITVPKFLKGQRVLVKQGPFAGVEGIVARFMGQQRVGISIEGLMTMVTAYVPSAFLVRVD